MSRRYLNETAVGAKVDTILMIASKELRRSRTGESFLLLGLSDRTGTVPAYRFTPTSAEVEIPVGGFVHVTGRMGLFRGRRRLTLDSLSVATDIDPVDFLKRSVRPTDEMVAELREHVRSVRNRSLARILRAAFADRSVFDRFTTLPLSVDGPYSYVGGLLEHTLAVAGACASLVEHHPDLDADVLIAAAILHDIGTVEALELDVVAHATDEGRLLGHVALSDRVVVDAARRAGVKQDDPTLLALRHAIAAHHNLMASDNAELRPATIEAAALAGADAQNLTLAAFAGEVGAAVRVDESWTAGANRFHRPLYSGPFIAVDGQAATA